MDSKRSLKKAVPAPGFENTQNLFEKLIIPTGTSKSLGYFEKY
jgi:hypothetical protein